VVTRHFGTRTLRYQDISVPLTWSRSVRTATRHFGTRTLRYQDISVPLTWSRSVRTVRVWSRSVLRHFGTIPELSDSFAVNMPVTQADHSCYQKTRNPLHANPMQLLYVGLQPDILSKCSPTMEPCTFRYLLPRT